MSCNVGVWYRVVYVTILQLMDNGHLDFFLNFPLLNIMLQKKSLHMPVHMSSVIL